MKLLIKQLKKKLIYIIYNIVILIIAFIFNKFFQMLLFILFFNVLQNTFSARFHADSIFEKDHIKAVKYCKIITIVVEVIYLIFCENLKISLYSNLFCIFIIALINCLLQLFLENYIINDNVFNNYDKLMFVCKKVKLTDLSTKRMILKYIEKKSYEEIAEIECVDLDSIKQSIKRSKRKIKELM